MYTHTDRSIKTVKAERNYLEMWTFSGQPLSNAPCTACELSKLARERQEEDTRKKDRERARFPTD